MHKNLDFKIPVSKIIYSMIKQNKSQEYIIEILKELDICQHTPRSLDKFTFENLAYRWDKLHDKWIKTSSTIFSVNCYLNIETTDNIPELVDIPESYLDRLIRIPSGINIPKLQALELACTILNEGEKISVSTNDAETLLKNMAAIQSKLNEIVKVLNKISGVFNTDKNMD